MFSAASVCLCICQHDNFQKHRMMKLGVGALHKNLGRIRIWELQSPWVSTPKNVAFGYNVGKISAGCLVSYINGMVRHGICDFDGLVKILCSLEVLENRVVDHNGPKGPKEGSPYACSP